MRRHTHENIRFSSSGSSSRRPPRPGITRRTVQATICTPRTPLYNRDEEDSHGSYDVRMTSTQPDMYLRAPMAEGEDHLSTLPTELLVIIVEQLPVREICRLRSLSRHLRDFVDTNQGVLTQKLINRHRARIEAEYKLLTDLSYCDIIDAFRRYDSHYGFVIGQQITESSLRKLEAISPTLSFNWTKSHGFPAAGQHRIAGKWMQLCSIVSHPDNRGIVIEHFSNAAADVCHQSHVWSQGFTNAEAFKIKLTQVASIRNDAAYPGFPSTFITGCSVATKRSSQRWRHQDLSSYWERFELQRLLVLPDLKSKEGALAYCLRSEETASLLFKAKQGRSTRLKQAVLIEDLFIW